MEYKIDTDIVAIVVEGGSERAIIDLLLDNHKLIVGRENLLEEAVINDRAGKRFATKHLDHSFDGRKVKIWRILDSKTERFKVPKPYEKKISDVQDFYTRPEIEILLVLYFDDYVKFRKSGMKPSEFAKQNYSDYFRNVKSKDEMVKFWRAKVDELVATLKRYQSMHKDENTIANLIK